MGDAGDGDVLANLTNSSASGKEAPGAGELVVGIILTLMGAATLAFSMTIQRYALAHPKPTIPYCGLQLKKKWVWGFGLLLYGVANVFKVIGLMFGPMTVLSSVFTTLLIFNLFIANKLLDEKITPPKVAGAVFILVGAGLCTGATPEGIPENYSPDDVIGLLSKPPPFGWFLVVLMVLFAAAALVMMVRVEKKYPIIDDNGEIYEEHALTAEVLAVAERRMSMAPSAILRQPAVLMKQTSAKVFPDAWEAARRSAVSTAERDEERARVRRASEGFGEGLSENSGGWRAASKASKISCGVRGVSSPAKKGRMAPMASMTEEEEQGGDKPSQPPPSPPGPHAASPRGPSLPPIDSDALSVATPPSPPPSPPTTASSGSLREHLEEAPPRVTMPAALNRAMTVLYPTSLGVDEALADLCVRAYSSMMAEAGLLTALTYWVLYFKIVLGTVAGVLSAVFYMPYVYRRYETTVALPIEYGALNAGNIASGLLFYGESQYMQGWQIGMALGGCAVILFGIAIGLMDRLPFWPERNRQ